MQLDRYVIIPAGRLHTCSTLRLALAEEGWEAVVAREWPAPAIMADNAALAPGDVVLAWKAADPTATGLRSLAASGNAAKLFFLNYEEHVEGAWLAHDLTGAAAQAVCPEHDGGDAVLWNVQPHGGRDMFFGALASCLARLGQGSVVDPYAGARRWRRLIQSSLPNPLFVPTAS